MLFFLLFLFLSSYFVIAFQNYSDEALKDKILSWPHSNFTLTNNQFSGYLNISDDKFIHYIYIESESNVNNDSLIFWTNGGPGCSGLLGLFTEFGPWRVKENGKLILNPFRWSLNASIVFLEQPINVGFSFSSNPKLGPKHQYNDFLSGADNYQAIKAFFNKFPETRKRSFYVASESYGGHYIPHWTLEILNSDLENEEEHMIYSNFKGLLLGNPYTSFASGSIAMANVIWGLQMIPKPLWDKFVDKKCHLLNNSAYSYDSESPDCFGILDKIISITDNLNPYALEFPICTNSLQQDNALSALDAPDPHRVLTNSHPIGLDRSPIGPQSDHLLKFHKRSLEHFQTQSKGRVSLEKPNLGKIRNPHSLIASMILRHSQQLTQEVDLTATQSSKEFQYDPCSETNTVAYLNRPEVQKALHVWNASGSGVVKWDFCSDDVNENWSFNDYLADTTELYSKIFSHEKKPTGFRILVYSGDGDGVCATVGTQHWIFQIQGTEVKDLFQPWRYMDAKFHSQQGGFYTTFYDGLTFATVHGAGHEVPAYQPEKALELLRLFLDGRAIFEMSSSSSSSSPNSDQLSSSQIFLFVIGALLVVVSVISALVSFKDFII